MPPRFYTLQRGDTLGEVARRHRTTVKELCRINGISDPDRVEAGQVIALDARAVCKVQVLLIDCERNPIPNAKVRLDYGGKSKVLTSRENGSLPEIITASPEQLIDILIMRLNGTWKKITQVSSGWGNKLVTLKSPKLRLTAKTKLHPPKAVERCPKCPTSRVDTGFKTIQARSTTADGKLQAHYGDGKGPKMRDVESKDGLPVGKVTNDQSGLEFLTGYVGGTLEENDYIEAACELGCDVNVIKAIAKVESGSISGFDNKNRPKILYERHIFSKHTNKKYDKSNADLSSSKTYRVKHKNVKLTQCALDRDYYASSSEKNYERFAKAYSLNKEAAVMACSWGKFQILGENYKGCGYRNISTFLEDQVRSESGQLNTFIRFIKMKNLQKALKEKNWAEIAKGYNGKYYKRYNYDVMIREAYEGLH